MLSRWEKTNIIYRLIKLVGNLSAYFYFIRYHEENQYLADKIIYEIKEGGNIFWKLTQWICARVEFQYDLDDNYLINKLKHFYEDCPCHSFEETMRILDNGVKDKLKMVEKEPIASGSIGQVHKGILKDGRTVAIKVRHPGIRDNIIYLCETLNYVKDVLYGYNRIKDNVMNFDLDGLDDYLLDQTDFRKEYGNLKKLRKLFKKAKYVYFPEPICSGDDYLIMEYIEGQNIDDCLKESTKKGNKKHWDSMLKFWLFIRESVILRDFCHADLHKGNWKICKNRIVIYDLGIILDKSENFDDYRKIWEGFESRQPKIYVPVLIKNLKGEYESDLGEKIIEYMDKNMDLNVLDFVGDIRLLLNYLNSKRIIVKFHLLSYLMAFNISLANFKNFTFIKDVNNNYVISYLDRFTLYKNEAKKNGNIDLLKSIEKDESKFMDINKDRIKKSMKEKDEKMKEIDSILDEITDE